MRRWHGFSIVAIVLAALAAPPSLFAQQPAVPAAGSEFKYFAFQNDPHYDSIERGALWVVLGMAVAGLLYAGMLVGQVLGADQGTEKMRTVAAAIRAGANAYLARQFRAIILLVFLITGDRLGHDAGASPAGRRRDRPGGGVLHGGDLLVDRRLRRHEPGGARATSASPPRPGPASARRCSSATAPARSPAC